MTSLLLRPILAALIAGALGLSLAPAYAAKSSGAVAKRSQSARVTSSHGQGHRRNNLGGIHPLVGSGDY